MKPIGNSIKHKYLELLLQHFDETVANRLIEKVKVSNSTGDFQMSDGIRMSSDILITYAELNLKTNGYHSFLLGLSRILINQGEISFANELLQNNIDSLSKANVSKEVLAKSHLSIGETYCKQAMWKESDHHIKTAKSLFEILKDNSGLGNCEFLYGTMYLEKGDLETANIRFENCLNYIDKEKDKSLVAMVDVNYGIIKYIEGNYKESIAFYDKGLKYFAEDGDLRRVAEVMHNIGMIHQKNEQFNLAQEHFLKSISIAKDASYLPIMGLSYLNLAEIYSHTGEYEQSLTAADKAMKICYRINDKLSIAEVYKIKGIIYRKQFKYPDAEELLLTSLRLNRILNSELNFTETSFELGVLYKEMNQPEKAKQHFANALKYYEKVKSPNNISKIKNN